MTENIFTLFWYNCTPLKRCSQKPSYYSACVPAIMWRPDLPHAPLPLYASPVLTCCLIQPQSQSLHWNHWKSSRTPSANRPSFVTEPHTQHTGSVPSVGFEFTWNYNCLYTCVLLCSVPNVIFNAKMLFLVSTFKVTPLAPYILCAAALQRTSWLASILPDWFDATVRPLWCLDLTRVAFLACLIIPLSLLTSHFILRSTWSAVDNRAGLELFIAWYNKSAEFNMGSVLWASSGSQSRSPPVETSIRPQTVSDGFTVSFDCLDRQAWPRFIERYDKSLREGIFFTIFFLNVTSAEFVRHKQQKTGCSGTAKWDL